MYHPIAAARRIDTQEELDALSAEWAVSPDAALLAMRNAEVITPAVVVPDIPVVPDVPAPLEVAHDARPASESVTQDSAVSALLNALLPGTAQ